MLLQVCDQANLLHDEMPWPSLGNHRCGLGGICVFPHFDSDSEAKIPHEEFRNWSTDNEKQLAMGYLPLSVLFFRLVFFKYCDEASVTKQLIAGTSAKFRLHCIFFLMLQSVAFQICDNTF